jgi:hypothetical protein
MIRLVYLLLMLLLLADAGTAQDSVKTILPDTAAVNQQLPAAKPNAPVPDSVNANLFSVTKRPLKDTSNIYQDVQFKTAQQYRVAVYSSNPYFGFTSTAVKAFTEKRNWQGKEVLFYSLVVLVLFFALFRLAFYKYLHDLLGLFFKNAVKQRQLREQLIQAPLASLLLNLFFIISTAFYIDFILQHYQIALFGNFWLMILYAAAFLAVIYSGKFIWLKLAGWIFNLQEATDSYIFIVFIINKIIGIFLLPFLILLAFSTGVVYEVSFTLSVIGIAGLLGYRFILTYAAVRSHIKVNLFHFFLYLCAFEIIPLLLIYKVLLLVFERSS